MFSRKLSLYGHIHAILQFSQIRLPALLRLQISSASKSKHQQKNSGAKSRSLSFRRGNPVARTVPVSKNAAKDSAGQDAAG